MHDPFTMRSNGEKRTVFVSTVCTFIYPGSLIIMMLNIFVWMKIALQKDHNNGWKLFLVGIFFINSKMIQCCYTLSYICTLEDWKQSTKDDSQSKVLNFVLYTNCATIGAKKHSTVFPWESSNTTMMTCTANSLNSPDWVQIAELTIAYSLGQFSLKDFV